MPTYDYVCDGCGHAFELFQSMTDSVKKTCPKCRGRLKRLLGTGAGIIFKGSGFYLTDSGRGGKSDTAPGASESRWIRRCGN